MLTDLLLVVLTANEHYAVITRFDVDVESADSEDDDSPILCPGDILVKWRRYGCCHELCKSVTLNAFCLKAGCERLDNFKPIFTSRSATSGRHHRYPKDATNRAPASTIPCNAHHPEPKLVPDRQSGPSNRIV